MTGEWHANGPGVQVEFARQSRDGRLTLVMVGSGPVVASLWAVLGVADLASGAEALRRREETASRYIGVWPSAAAPQSIGVWAEEHKLTGVVWTALPPKFQDTEARVATAAETMSYLRSLQGERMERAREYVRRAPVQIRTPIRDLIERELGWTPGA